MRESLFSSLDMVATMSDSVEKSKVSPDLFLPFMPLPMVDIPIQNENTVLSSNDLEVFS